MILKNCLIKGLPIKNGSMLAFVVRDGGEAIGVEEDGHVT